MQNRPLLIGITGGIGAGKSIVCEVFSVLKVPVYEADTRAKALMEESAEVVTQIKSFFGEDSYFDTGKLNRSYLSNEVFNKPENLEKINQIVHPAVEQDFSSWVASKAEYPYVLKESIALGWPASKADGEVVREVQLVDWYEGGINDKPRTERQGE